MTNREKFPDNRFILTTSNEDHFPPSDCDEIRFWVNKVPVLDQETLINIER